MNTRFRRLLGLLCATAFMLGCDMPTDTDLPPGPGAVELVLVSPNPDDGAVLLSLTSTGVTVDSVVAAGFDVARTTSGSGPILVWGKLANGSVLARAWLADRSKGGDLQAEVHQVAARGSYVQRDPAAYSVSVRSVD